MQRIRSVFYHAYNSYLDNAFPYDKLRPLPCDGQDAWGRSPGVGLDERAPSSNGCLTPHGMQFAWIGLYNDVNSWRWSLSDTSFYGPEEEEFRQWKEGEPDNDGGAQHCTAMFSGDGLWHDNTCTSNHQAVCCDVRGLNVTFILTNDSMTWTEAQSYCREHHTDLSSVRNQAENQEVQELVPGGGGAVWIGLFRDSWKWSDGSNSSSRYWVTGQPDNWNGMTQDCAVADFSSSGGWWDENCDLKHPFICSSPGEW
ncbi:lactose-binding lectin l-2-like [Centropristis striata]|uniref:lactose-binding lectin l-2-like n=1 Tax=Centropristis striata TaxID=184440 RepID=UPI0027E015D0|nr:lactose-binding lectin l-2-like [Centropristis striata]